MSVHDYVIDNDTGANVRADINNVLAAIVSNNSSATAPPTTYPFMWWADTATGDLKIRDAANTSWVTVGSMATTNFGLAPLASPSFTGTVTSAGDIQMTGTGAIDVAAGTTAERPGSPSAGMIRFNTTDTTFEGYNGSGWGAIGGGATGGGPDAVFYENGQTVTTDYTLTTNNNAVSAGPITINSGITVTIPSGSNWVIV